MLQLIPLLLLSSASIAQENHDHGQEPEAPLTSGEAASPGHLAYDVVHYGLTLKVDPEHKSIAGHVRMTARWVQPTDMLTLDLDEHLKVTSVQIVAVNSIALAEAITVSHLHEERKIFAHVGPKLEELKQEKGGLFTLLVEYGGVPRVAPRPPWDGGFQWSTTPSGKPWIATSCQMQGPDLWWPCKDQPDDEPDSMDIIITVPKGLICASNGKFEGSKAEGDWTTFHWKVNTPINAYGIALNIAPYEKLTRQIKSSAGDEFEVSYWVLPENLEKGKVLFEDLVRQVHWFEKVYGPYPFRADKLGVAETPHLGMEHQSITAYGNNYRGNPWGADQGFDFLLHHELSHEWWANLVTCRNWKDFWIHESFGTYAQSLYTEHLKGPEAYRTRMAEIRGGMRNLAAIGVPRAMSSAEVYFGKAGNDIYNKGAWVLHTLRWLVNDDETFFLMLRRMAYPDPALENLRDGSACRFTDTDEIQAIAEQHSGLDLGWFFDVYIRSAALPQLIQDHRGDELHLSWVVPDAPDAKFPLAVQVNLDGKMQRIEMPGGKATIDVSGVQTFQLDPHQWLLRE
ncbi:MAG: aminopeptidase N [Candidatus Paceibacteria bacterium]|jgi:aminopeptidase N